MIEGDDGQGFFGLRLGLEVHRASVARGTAALQSLAHVVVGDNRRLLLEVRVPAGVIFVVVGVDDEPHRLIRDAFQRGLNLVSQRGVLVVDDHDAVIAYRSANVAASTLQHINVAGHFRDLHLYFAEVVVLSRGPAAGEQQTYR